MELRMLEALIPETSESELREILEDRSIIVVLIEKKAESYISIKIILSSEKTEEITDLLEQKYSHKEGFRIILLPVEATIPRIEEKKPEVPEEDEDKKAIRISREELYSDILTHTKLSNIYISMIILSSIVASVGLLRDNIAVIIGAMVIAPLLGPNVGLAFSTTLGDMKLARNALRTNISGIITALLLSIIIGYNFPVESSMSEIFARTEVGLSDIILALASGSAGVLAFTSGASMALIGVMVAVALMPPLISLGLLIGSGHSNLAFGAFLLLMSNLICINLSGVLTFLIQGIRPRRWWEADQAKKATIKAILIWSFLLAVLILILIAG